MPGLARLRGDLDDQFGDEAAENVLARTSRAGALVNTEPTPVSRFSRNLFLSFSRRGRSSANASKSAASASSRVIPS